MNVTWSSRWATRLGLFGERDFRLFFAGQGVSQLGDWLNRVGLIVLVYSLTGQTAGVAVLLLAQMIPRALILPFGGVLADRLPKRRLMLATDLARAALALAFALVPLLPSARAGLWFTYGVVVALQVCTSLFNPARSAAIPGLVPAEALGSANALVGVVGQAAMLLGPAIGGLIVVAWGVNAVFATNAATFLFSALLLWLMRLDEPARGTARRRPVLAELREGASAVAASRPLQACLASFALVGGANLCLNVTIVELLVGPLGRTSASLGLLLTLVGLGMIAASVPSAWVLRALPALPLLIGAVFLLGLDTSLIGLATSYSLVAVAFVANGFLTAAADVICETSIQRLAPPDRLGRVFGLHQWTMTLGYVCGAACGGFVPLLIGTPATLIAVGLVVAFSSVAIGLATLRPQRATVDGAPV